MIVRAFREVTEIEDNGVAWDVHCFGPASILPAWLHGERLPKGLVIPHPCVCSVPRVQERRNVIERYQLAVPQSFVSFDDW